MPLLNEYQTAERLGISVSTLRSWRLRGGPLPHVKIGRSVRYTPEAIERLIAENEQSDPASGRGSDVA